MFKLGRGVITAVALGAFIFPASAVGDETARQQAIDKMVARIVLIESGNNCAARNPLNSAVGLGQFTESVWLRAVEDYRPDLMAGKSRQEVLNLRLDCGLSEAMLRNVGAETAKYLEANNHEVTAGRLYLAHFLGPAGAEKIILAAPDAQIKEVLGPLVVEQNPFLEDWTTSMLLEWADRKISRE